MMFLSASLWGETLVNKEIKVQLASFSNKVNAEKYIEHQEELGKGSELASLPFKIKIVEVHITKTEKTVHRVIAITDSKRIADDIMAQTKYKGSFIIANPLKG